MRLTGNNERFAQIPDRLLPWFREHARCLPWRSDPTPYHVWVSEIMLQQTRVEAVKRYYERFIETLPDIPALAEVSEEILLKLWEGLGYYSRARNLQKAARLVMQQYNGVLPADYQLLRELPGIGSYTAGAIAAIAFGLPEAAVDGNVLRVMKRVEGSFDDITKEAVKRELEADIRELIPDGHCSEFTQSLMELGALVCVPNGQPFCGQCPLHSLCRAFREDTIRQIPVKPAPAKRRVEQRTVYLLEYKGKYALHKRTEKGLLSGLWEFPNREGFETPDQTRERFHAEQVEILGKAKHVFSHIEWHMEGYLVHLSEYLPDYEWTAVEQIDGDYALPAAFTAYREKIIPGDVRRNVRKI